jgi:SWI/SNF-related matrix-associated actin-dependent regulator 1 of chromatin subfamily A
MGLGKTLQGLAIANFYKDKWPLFIVSPSSVKFMWKEQIKLWISDDLRRLCHLKSEESVDDLIYCMDNGKQAIDPQCKVVITSYEILNRNIDVIEKVKYKVVIVDESHLLKTSKAARTKSATRLIQNAEHVLLLSGTPALSRPAELFSQLQLINPTMFASFHDFGMRYCDGKETNFGMNFQGFSHMNELRLLLDEKLLMRREKRDVMSELPSKMRELIILNPSLIELNTKALNEASNLMKNVKGSDKHKALLQYFHETSQTKAKAVCEYVADLLESGKKFIVFAHFANMITELEQLCVTEKYDYIKIDGKTPSKHRQELVDKFQNTETCQIALLSITAANSGITLTQASLVVFAELYWNPGILVQAEDRVYRIGQQNSVNVHYLCAKGTSDDEMWSLVKQKLNVLGGAGLTKENFSQANAIDNFQNNKIEKPNLFQELLDEDEPWKLASLNVNQIIDDDDDDDLLCNMDLSKFDAQPPMKKYKM